MAAHLGTLHVTELYACSDGISTFCVFYCIDQQFKKVLLDFLMILQIHA